MAQSHGNWCWQPWLIIRIILRGKKGWGLLSSLQRFREAWKCMSPSHKCRKEPKCVSSAAPKPTPRWPRSKMMTNARLRDEDIADIFELSQHSNQTNLRPFVVKLQSGPEVATIGWASIPWLLQDLERWDWCQWTKKIQTKPLVLIIKTNPGDDSDMLEAKIWKCVFDDFFRGKSPGFWMTLVSRNFLLRFSLKLLCSFSSDACSEDTQVLVWRILQEYKNGCCASYCIRVRYSTYCVGSPWTRILADQWTRGPLCPNLTSWPRRILTNGQLCHVQSLLVLVSTIDGLYVGKKWFDSVRPLLMHTSHWWVHPVMKICGVYCIKRPHLGKSSLYTERRLNCARGRSRINHHHWKGKRPLKIVQRKKKSDHGLLLCRASLYSC